MHIGPHRSVPEGFRRIITAFVFAKFQLVEREKISIFCVIEKQRRTCRIRGGGWKRNLGKGDVYDFFRFYDYFLIRQVPLEDKAEKNL